MEYIKQKLSLLYYICDRWSIEQVENELGQLLRLGFPKESNVWNETHKYYFKCLIVLIIYVRDVKMKGEYSVSYAMIYTMYLYYPKTALKIVEWLVYADTATNAPKYGCWKDMKKLAEYVYQKTNNANHELIRNCITLLNAGLRKNVSNIAKWIPREKSKHGWLFELLALDWSGLLDETGYVKVPFSIQTPDYQSKKWELINRAKRTYRKYVSAQNAVLKTTEIYMCNDRDQIMPENVNLLTLHKNMNSLTNSFNNKTLEHKKKAFEIYSWTSKYYNQTHLVDNISILGYNTYYSKPYAGGGIGKNRHLAMYSNKATKLNVEDKKFGDTLFRNVLGMDIEQHELKRYCDTKNQIDLLNREWLHICGNCETLHNVLPILDMSLTMFENGGERWNHALSLACLIASKSTLGSRILVMDHVPTWVNVEHSKQWMTKMVNKVNAVNGKTRKSVESVISILAESFLDSNMTDKSIEQTVFVFLSDMRFEFGEETLHSVINTVYSNYFTTRNHSVPPLPHIVYWNVGGATMLPCDINQSRVSIVGGNTTALLDVLNKIQYKSRRQMNPFQYMSNVLAGYTDITNGVSILD